eukprot:942620-Pelagomonas_calceolata.AAC.5
MTACLKFRMCMYHAPCTMPCIPQVLQGKPNLDFLSSTLVNRTGMVCTEFLLRYISGVHSRSSMPQIPQDNPDMNFPALKEHGSAHRCIHIMKMAMLIQIRSGPCAVSLHLVLYQHY